MSFLSSDLTQIQSIAFDLDDTLIDTTGLLVPRAAQKACEAMIANGLKTDIQTCVATRTKLLKKFEAQEIFTELALTFNQENIEYLAKIGFEIFYNPQVPTQLPLIQDAHLILNQLQKKYRLHLVTAGIPSTQSLKVKAAEIEKYFTSIQYVDISKKQNKGDAFLNIIQLDKIKNANLLCIGNRLTDEIYFAEKLNCPSCLFVFGEHQDESLTHPEIQPKFQINNLNSLIRDLGL